MLVWRNGRRTGLKIPRGQLHVGSTPTTSTKSTIQADGVTCFRLDNNVVEADFYYKKNAQNDIIGIYSTSGDEIARYEYDAWGNCVAKYLQDDGTYAIINNDYSYNDTTIINRFIAFKNPFRYRSYYYDFETNLYYLNSRYYDPQLGRFINADDVANLSNDFNGLNLYAYCVNNPINLTDECGHAWWHWLIAALVVIAAAVLTVVTAGGFAAGVAAVGSVIAGGTAMGLGATISAGIFIGSSVAFTGFAIYAGIEAISSGNINTFWNIGESAMWSTIGGGAFGALGGFMQYKEQHPKIKHSWTTEKSRY